VWAGLIITELFPVAVLTIFVVLLGQLKEAAKKQERVDRSTDMKEIWMLSVLLDFAVPASGQLTTYDTSVGHATPLIPTVQTELSNG
jgi:hypothetical protein